MNYLLGVGLRFAIDYQSVLSVWHNNSKNQFSASNSLKTQKRKIYFTLAAGKRSSSPVSQLPNCPF